MVKLTRRAVLQVAVEANYGVPETLGINDGILVADPEYSIDPELLERNIAAPDLSPEAVVLGRKLANMTFDTELRSNGRRTGLAADASVITRLFRGCGYSLTEVRSPEVHGVFQIDSHANEVAWAVSSGSAATGLLTLDANPAEDDTVTIGGVTYTFKSVLTMSANDVAIGATASATATNLANAINRSGVPGANYSEATDAHPAVSATAAVDNVTVTARVNGSAGNAITTTATGADISFADPALTGGANISTNTDLHQYVIEIVAGGASGVATYRVDRTESPGLPAWNSGAAAPLTSNSPIQVGPDGLEVTPTFVGDLVAGQRWVLWLLPVGLRMDPVSDDFESLTLGMNKDGVLHTMPGSYGTFEIEAEAGQYASVSWDFTGTWRNPVDAPLARPVYERTLPAQVEYARLRIDNYYAIVANFTYDQGNEISIRPDVSSPEGYIGTRITARNPEGGIDPEAVSVAEHDFWGRLGSAKRMPFQMRVGTQPGNIIWMLAPSTQYTGLTYQDRDGILTYDAGLRFSRYNGNDEFMLFFH